MILNCISINLDIISTGMLRLTDGLTQHEGRVEIYWDSEWKWICSDEWEEIDAVVVCRQLGYLTTSLQIHGTIIIMLSNSHYSTVL